jgi:hypothetical protein
VNCDLWRDLACNLERNEILDNGVQLAGEAAQRTPMRALREPQKSASKPWSTFFFSQYEDSFFGK